MKKILRILVAGVIFCISNSTVNAQSWGDIFNSGTLKNVVETATGGQSLTAESISGEWNYLQPAVQLTSDNILGNAAGVALSSKAESTLNTYCSKIGIVAGKFTFRINNDSSFSFELLHKTLTGTYTINEANGKIIFSFKALNTVNLVSIPAHASLVGDSLSLLFTADKLKVLVSALTSITGDNTSLSTVESLLNSYDGILIGFEFNKTTTESTSTTTNIISNTLNSLFGK